MTADLLRENARLGEMVIPTYAELHLMWQQGRTEIVRLQAELDAANEWKKRMMGVTTACNGKFVEVDGKTEFRNDCEWLHTELDALRTRLESVLDRGAKFQLAIHRARLYVTTEVAGNLIDDALAALAAIDTAATQGGAK